MLYAGCVVSIPFLTIFRPLFNKYTPFTWYESRHRWEMSVKMFLLIYQHVFIASLINVFKPNFNALGSISFVLSMGVIAFLVLWACFIMGIVIAYRLISHEKKEKYIFKRVFIDLDTSSPWKYMYYLMFFYKKTAFVLIFTFFNEFSKTSMTLTAIFVCFIVSPNQSNLSIYSQWCTLHS